jgi:hypothetical protein
VEFESNRTYVAEVRGDTLDAIKQGRTTLTARLLPNDNYYPAEEITTACVVIDNYFEIQLDRETLVPAFDVGIHDYTMMLPCSEDKEEVVTMRIIYDPDVDSLLLNGEYQSPNVIADYRISDKDNTYNIKLLDDTILKGISVMHFELRKLRGSGGVSAYTVNLQRRLPEMVTLLWNNTPDAVFVIDLNKLAELGDTISEYQWYYSVGPFATKHIIGGAVKPYLELAKLPYNTGSYTAVVLTTDSVKLEVCPFTIKIPPAAATAKLLAYPNPVASAVTIENPQWQDIKTIDVYDAYGKLQRQYPSSAASQTLDISGLKQGIYIVRVGLRVIRITVL